MSGDVPQAPGCALPFGLGFPAFVAILVLSLMLTGAAVTAVAGLLGAPPPGQAPLPAPGGPAVGGPAGPLATAQPAGPIPFVSDRQFGGGQATATVTGDAQLQVTMGVNRIISYAQDGFVWLSFSPEDPVDGPFGEVLVVFNEPADSVTVANGPLAAIGHDDQCAFDVQVSATLIEGEIRCPRADLYRDHQVVGRAMIVVEFSASS